jgi:hypothetical protein
MTGFVVILFSVVFSGSFMRGYSPDPRRFPAFCGREDACSAGWNKVSRDARSTGEHGGHDDTITLCDVVDRYSSYENAAPVIHC